MKKLFIRIFIFILFFTIIDHGIGTCFDILVANAKGGDTGRNNYIVDKTQAEIILFGSSRCVHHYDPRIIQNSLHMSCYNAGRDGNGILMMYPYYKMMSMRYQPKLIIYDLSDFDVQEDDHTKYLEWLRQFYGRQEVNNVVFKINSNERYKMICHSYRYNGKGLQIIADDIHPMQHDIMGYKPLSGIMKYDHKLAISNNHFQKDIDPLKKNYLIRLILDCKKNGTKLIFMVSPSFRHAYLSEYYTAIMSLCRCYHVPFLYYQNDKQFIFNRCYFKDSAHMNNVGAELYTKKVVFEIKKYLN